MGKHPVSTTIELDLNREVDDYCRSGKCKSKYEFIRQAIHEKMEKVKNEREQTETGRPSNGNEQPPQGTGGSVEKRTVTVDGVEYEL